MSVGTPELDRSVLERKDREELTTIATALGEKPTSRSKKADIVDLILRLAGVDETSASGGAEADASAGTSSDAAPAVDDDAKPRARRGGGRTRAKAPDDDAAPDAPRADTGTETDTEAGEDTPAEQRKPARSAAKSAVAKDSSVEDSSATDDHEPDAEPPAEWELFAAEDAAAAAAEAKSSTNGGRGAQGRRNSNDNGRSQGENRQQTQSNKQNDNGRSQGENRNGGENRSQGENRNGGENRSQGSQGDNRNQGNQGQNRGSDDSHGDNRQQNRTDGEPEAGNRRRRRRGRDRDRPGGSPAGGPEPVFEGEPVDVEGLLDLRDDGYGFLRSKGFLPDKDDAYVSVKQVRQFGLRKGDHIKGASRPPARAEKNPALLRIDLVNGSDPEAMRRRPRFEDLTPLFPDEKLKLESTDHTDMTARIVDLLSPIGKGQRGLIVSPPKAGKTTVMKTIARSIEQNNPEVHLIVLLVDERPEEVTDFRRWLSKGEVAASTFDRPSDEHTQVAELVIERAKRMVEEGKDVVIILDGITRLARAYNLAAPASGRIMSGGIDAGALYPPKRFFGAARNVEEGGSLTILATALVETNSRMDDHIFEEFKGTGNMELKLDRRLAERRIYPAIDVDASSTRHEELLFERRQLQQVWKLRRVLSGLTSEGASSAAGLEMLIDRLKAFPTNDEFLEEIAKAPSIG